MNIRNLIEGLKANYAPALHPTERAEKDMSRTLYNMGWDSDQLSKLYDELLLTCEYFPKVFDIHSAVSKLHLVRPDSNQLMKTRSMMDSYHQGSAISFNQWLDTGGYDQIRRDCQYDEVKIRKVMAMMNIVPRREPEHEKPRNHKSDMQFITDDLPEWDFPQTMLEDL